MRAQNQPEIQEPLMLVMPVKPGAAEPLKQALMSLNEAQAAKAIEDALTRVGTVHSTRFVVLEDGESAKLIVLALYDGSVDDYIAAFARELDGQFTYLFSFIEDTDDKPRTPVSQDVGRFVQYVRNRDVKPTNGQTYSAYPGLTALDIYEATRPPTDGVPTL